MASYYGQTKEQAFQTWKRVYISKDKSEQEIYSTVTGLGHAGVLLGELKDPNQFQGVEGQFARLHGVGAVRDLRQVLQADLLLDQR